MNGEHISWKRSDLKWRGKQAFRKNYWSCVLVSLILMIVMATGGSGAARNSAGDALDYGYGSGMDPLYGVTTYSFSSDGVTSYISHIIRSPLSMILALLGVSTAVTIMLLGVVFHFFVGNVLEAGGRGFYTENLYSTPGPGKILQVFRSGNYGNIVKTMFCRDLFVFLWSLLFIIPGIVKSYEYKMVPYLLAEYPDMDRREVFEKSREMMRGQKFDTFILDLSFLPWNILSSLTFGLVGLFYVAPYQDATFAELYDTLAAGMPGNGQTVYGNAETYRY